MEYIDPGYHRVLGANPRAAIIKAACEVVERCVDLDIAKIEGDFAYIPPNFTWAASHMLEPKNVIDAMERLGGRDIKLDTSNVTGTNYMKARFVLPKNSLWAIREKICEYRDQKNYIYYLDYKGLMK